MARAVGAAAVLVVLGVVLGLAGPAHSLHVPHRQWRALAPQHAQLLGEVERLEARALGADLNRVGANVEVAEWGVPSRGGSEPRAIDLEEEEEEVIGQGFPHLSTYPPNPAFHNHTIPVPTTQHDVEPTDQDLFESSKELELVHDATLTELYTSNGQPEFDANTSNYTLTVEGAVAALTVTAVPNCDKAAVVVAGVPVEGPGAASAPELTNIHNVFDVVVTASDQTTVLTYRMDVVRELGRDVVGDGARDLSFSHAKCLLGKLECTACNLEYNEDTYKWEGHVDADGDVLAALMVDVPFEDVTATLKIPGEEEEDIETGRSLRFPLNPGTNNMQVVVKAPDTGTKLTYFISIEKDKKEEEDEVPTVCENNCNHGRCDELLRRCVCEPKYVRRDCSVFAGETAFVVPVPHYHPSVAQLAGPMDVHASPHGSALYSTYKLRDCALELNKWFDPSTLPKACSVPVDFCRRIMGVVVPDAPDIQPRCEDVIRECHAQERDFGDCFFGIVAPLSEGADLLALDVEPGHVHDFHKLTKKFFAEVGSETENVVVAPVASEYSTIAINGVSMDHVRGKSQPIPLYSGPNKIEIVVTAENKITTNTYTLVVTRALKAVAKAGEVVEPFLTGIRTVHTSVTPAFDRHRHLYHAKLPASYETIAVFADIDTVQFPDLVGSTITVNGNAVPAGNVSQNLPMLYGPNRVTIRVTSPDAVTFTQYFLIVDREFGEAKGSSDSSLRLLSLVNTMHVLEPPFHSSQLVYNVNVGETTESVVVRAKTSHTEATLTIDHTGVVSGAVSEPISTWYGPNIIDVHVTAPDTKTTTKYRIHVHRAYPDQQGELLTESHLDNLFVDGSLAFDEPFQPAITSYVLRVAKEDDYVLFWAHCEHSQYVTVAGTAVPTDVFTRPIHLASAGTSRVIFKVLSESRTHHTDYEINIIRGMVEANMLETIVPSIGHLEPRFRSDLTNYELVLTPKLSAVKAVAFTVAHSPEDASVFVNDQPVTSGESSQHIDVLENFRVTNVEIKVVPADGSLPDRVYHIAVIRQSLKRPTTDYFNYLSRFGTVPNDVDKGEYCRLDRCYNQLSEMGSFDQDTQTMPPACSTALGQSRMDETLAHPHDPSWLAHFQCPMSAMCRSLKDCMVLLAECKVGLDALNQSALTSLKSWYHLVRQRFREMDTSLSGFISRSQLLDGLQDHVGLSEVEAKSVMGHVVFEDRVLGNGASTQGLSMHAYLNAAVQGMVPVGLDSDGVVRLRMRRLFDQFNEWVCDEQARTICPTSIKDGLVKLGYDHMLATHVADEMDRLSNGQITFDGGYMSAVLAMRIPIDHVMDLPQEQDAGVMHELLTLFMNADHSSRRALGKDEFGALVKGQRLSADISDREVLTLFQACVRHDPDQMSFGEFVQCAVAGVVPLDVLTGDFAHYRQFFDMFAKADTAGLGRLRRQDVVTALSTIGILLPFGELEQSFAKFIAKQLDVNSDDQISQAEFTRGVVQHFVHPPNAHYAWARTYELWLLFRTFDRNKDGSASMDQVVHRFHTATQLEQADAYFLANIVAQLKSSVHFSDLTGVFGTGLGAPNVAKYSPEYTSSQLDDFVQALDSDRDKRVVVGDISAALASSLHYPDALATFIGRVMGADAGGSEGEGDKNTPVPFSALLGALRSGLVVVRDLGFKGQPGEPLQVLMKITEANMDSPDSVVDVADARDLLSTYLHPHGFDSRHIDILVRNSEDGTQGGAVSVRKLVGLLNAGLHSRIGRAGEIRPQEMAFVIFRAMLYNFNHVGLNDDTLAIPRDRLERFFSEAGVEKEGRDLALELLDGDKDGVITLGEYQFGWRCGAVPRSPVAGAQTSKLLSMVLSEYAQLATNADGAVEDSVPLPALHRHLQGRADVSSHLVDVLVLALASENEAGVRVVERVRFAEAALVGLYPLVGAPKHTNLHEMLDTIRQRFAMLTKDGSSTISHVELANALKSQGFNDLEATLVSSAVDTGDPAVERITAWEFGRAVFRGVVPLVSLVADAGDGDDDQDEAGQAAEAQPINEQAAQAAEALGRYAELAPDEARGELDATHVQKHLTQQLSASEPQAKALVKAMRVNALPNIGLVGFLMGNQRGVFDSTTARINQLFELVGSVRTTGQVPVADLAGLYSREGFTALQAQMLAQVVSSLGKSAVEQLSGAFVQSLLPYGMLPDAKVALYVASAVWVEEAQGSDVVLPTTSVVRLLTRKGLTEDAAAAVAEACGMLEAGKVLFTEFYHAVRPQRVPIALEWNGDTQEMQHHMARVLSAPATMKTLASLRLDNPSPSHRISVDQLEDVLRMSDLPDDVVAAMTATLSPINSLQFVDHVLDGSLFFRPRAIQTHLASKPKDNGGAPAKAKGSTKAKPKAKANTPTNTDRVSYLGHILNHPVYLGLVKKEGEERGAHNEEPTHGKVKAKAKAKDKDRVRRDGNQQASNGMTPLGFIPVPLHMLLPFQNHTLEENAASSDAVSMLELEVGVPMTSNVPFEEWKRSKPTEPAEILGLCSGIGERANAPQCRDALVGTYGFSSAQAAVLTDSGAPFPVSDLTSCLINERQWDCKMVVNAFLSYALGGHNTLSLQDLVDALLGMGFDDNDANVVANAVDYNSDLQITFGEWLSAWHQDVLPVYRGSGTAERIIRKIRRTRAFFPTFRCSENSPTISPHRVATHCTKHSDPDAASTASEAEQLAADTFMEQVVAHRIAQLPNSPTSVDETTYVTLMLHGIVPTPTERAMEREGAGEANEAERKGAVDVVRQEFESYEKGGSGVVFRDEMADRMSVVLGLKKEHAKLLAISMATHGKAEGAEDISGIRFANFLRFAMLGAVPLRSDVTQEGTQFDYAQIGSAGYDGLASLQDFKTCYFNRRRAIVQDAINADDASDGSGAPPVETKPLEVTKELDELVEVAVDHEFTLDFGVEGATEFQWFVNDIPGPITPVGSITKYAELSDSGVYKCEARNAGGTTMSRPCRVKVTVPESENNAYWRTNGDAVLPPCPRKSATRADPGDEYDLTISNHVTSQLQLVIVTEEGDEYEWQPMGAGGESEPKTATLPGRRGVPYRAYVGNKLVSEFANPKDGSDTSWEVTLCE